MKSKINEMTEQEKNRILEMYNMSKTQIDEQGIFSGLRSKIKGGIAQAKTGFQNVKGAFSRTQGQAMRPSAGLQRDLTMVQSRGKDLSASIQPMLNELNQMSQKLQSNASAYGQGYEQVQAEFAEQLNGLIQVLTTTTQSLAGLAQYQPTYQAPAPAAGQPITTNTQQGAQQAGGQNVAGQTQTATA